MKLEQSGIILAGGKNSRFLGKNKAFLKINDKKLIDYVYDIFYETFQEVIIVTNSPDIYAEMDALIVTDIIPKRCSLSGIHTGLFYSSFPYSFFAACDMPFLKKNLVQAITSKIEPHIDIVVPCTNLGFEPLCALYSKRCISAIENLLKKDSFNVKKVFNIMKTKKLSEEYIKKFDNELISFFNINSQEELEKAKGYAKK
jgi:molybdenum cofactor guanylyltransferase